MKVGGEGGFGMKMPGRTWGVGGGGGGGGGITTI